MGQRIWMKRVLPLIFVVIVAACGRGGGSISVDETTSPKQIITMAEAKVAHHRYRQAGDLYLEVDRLYPYTTEAEYAVIQAAKAYQAGKKRIESRSAAQRYIDYYPAGKYAPLAYYLVALSYYDQILDVGRDQQNTFKASQALRVLLDKYPNSEYAALAKPKFATALNQLAGKEMQVGRYYLKRHEYAAAIKRFTTVAEAYGETRHRPEALERLVEANISLGLLHEAGLAAAQLAANYPDSPWNAAAKRLLTQGR